MFSTSIYSVAHQSQGSRSEAAETTQTTLLNNNNNNNNNNSRLSCRASRVGSSIVMVQISYLHVSAVESSNMVERQSNNNVISVVNIETTVSQPPVISK